MPEEVADTRPVRRDCGPAGAGHRGAPAALHHPVLLRFPLLSLGSWRRLCPECCLWSPLGGPQSARRPLPGAPPDRSSACREGGRAFLPGCLSGGFLLAMPSSSPPRTSALDGSCVTQGPGNCPPYPPGRGSLSLQPPRALSRTMSREAAPAGHCPPHRGAGTLAGSSCEGQLWIWGLSRVLIPVSVWVPGQVENLGAVVRGSVLPSLLCSSSSPAPHSAVTRTADPGWKACVPGVSRVAVQHAGAGEVAERACRVNGWYPAGMGLGRRGSALDPGLLSFQTARCPERHSVLFLTDLSLPCTPLRQRKFLQDSPS